MGLIELTNMDLLLKLRRNTKKLNTRRNKRILGTTIEDRTQFGHWEIDTVIGVKQKEEPVLLKLTERKHRFELILKIEGKTDKALYKALQPLMQSSNAKTIFKTITSDNGIEFASLTNAVKDVADVYFTHPYTSVSVAPMKITMASFDDHSKKCQNSNSFRRSDTNCDSLDECTPTKNSRIFNAP